MSRLANTDKKWLIKKKHTWYNSEWFSPLNHLTSSDLWNSSNPGAPYKAISSGKARFCDISRPSLNSSSSHDGSLLLRLKYMTKPITSNYKNATLFLPAYLESIMASLKWDALRDLVPATSLKVTLLLAEPNTVFEFGWRHECIWPLEHHKRQKILQTDRCFLFCFLFSLNKYTLL